MAVYRDSPSPWRRYLPTLIVVVVIVVVVILGLLISRSSPGKATDRVGEALDVIGQSVDLFAIEYAKVAKGTPPSQTGAPGAIDRALAAFAGVEADLRKVDDPAASALSKDLTALKAALDMPSSDVETPSADASAQIVALRRARQATPGR
jgi:hypothetical protein